MMDVLLNGDINYWWSYGVADEEVMGEKVGRPRTEVIMLKAQTSDLVHSYALKS
jgi:hypothetical protein